MIVVERFNKPPECIENAVEARRTWRETGGGLVADLELFDAHGKRVARFHARDWKGCTKNLDVETVERIFSDATLRPSSAEARDAMLAAPYQISSEGAAVMGERFRSPGSH